MKTLVAVVVLSLVSPLSFAADIFFGPSVGYYGLSSGGSTNGVHGQLNLNGAADVSKTWLLDLGLGASFSSLGAEQTSGQFAGAVGSLSARGRIGASRWQLGPVAEVLVGPGATASYLYSSAAPQTEAALFGGLKAVYSIPAASSAMRVSFQATTDVSVPDRQVWIVMTGFQLAFGAGEAVRSDVVQTSQAAPQSEAPTASISELIAKFQKNGFKNKSAALTRTASSALNELAAALVQNQDSWKELRVVGHTDLRGSDAFNDRLSKDRAAAVQKALVDRGVRAERLAVVGQGKREPLVAEMSSAAHRANRRVEISVVD